MELPKINTPVGLEDIEAICREFGLLSLWDKIRKDPPKLPFSSDGASCFPDQIGDVNIYPAAFFHDLKYWAGYPGEEADRFISDCELAIDVVRLCGGSPSLATTIFQGVRIGGSDELPTSWRWGFGRE